MKLLNRSEFFKYVNFSFILKVIIIFSIINLLIFEIRFVLREIDPSPRIKIYFKGIIFNPESLYQASLYLEGSGKLEDAIVDIKLAISLLEAGNYSPATRSRYAKRLQYLEKKVESMQSKN
jgi:hypothetical protein